MESTWESKGRIEVDNGRIILPELPDEAGLYRLMFDEHTVYIGEAGDIQRRVGDYVRYYPSVGIESEFRIHNALMKSGGADVAVLTGSEFASRSQRCVREHLEIKEARKSEANMRVLNGGTIAERIAFLKSEIQRLEKQLDSQTVAEGERS